MSELEIEVTVRVLLDRGYIHFWPLRNQLWRFGVEAYWTTDSAPSGRRKGVVCRIVNQSDDRILEHWVVL